MPKYYFESEMGCGIRIAKSLLDARRKILREVGSYNWKGSESVRLATEKDVDWVAAMGGRTE